MNKSAIFSRDAVFTSFQSNQDQLLKEIYDKLLDLGYVKGDFWLILLKENTIFQLALIHQL